MWVMYALMASLFAASLAQVNQHFRIDGVRLAGLRALAAFALLLPFAFTITWPRDTDFYLLALPIGLMTFFAGMWLFNAAMLYGGRLTVLYMAIRIVMAFVLWLALDSVYRAGFLAQPLVAAGLGASLLLAVVGVLRLRRDSHSAKALLLVIPAGVALAVSDILTKAAMFNLPQTDALVALILVILLLETLLAWSWISVRRLPRIANSQRRRYATAGVLTGALYVGLVVAMVMAINNAPNPGYVSAVSLLSVVWLAIWYRVRHIKSPNQTAALVLIVLGAAGVAILGTM